MFKIKEVKPLFTGIITTAHVYSEDVQSSAGIYLADKLAGTMNQYQWVKAVGPMVTGIEKGNIVHINFKRYFKPKHVPGTLENNVITDRIEGTYEIPSIEIDGRQYLFLQNNDIDYVVSDYDLQNDGGLIE